MVSSTQMVMLSLLPGYEPLVMKNPAVFLQPPLVNCHYV